jgi:hypothetical protein
MTKTLVMVGTAEQQFLLDSLLESAQVDVSAEQRQATLELLAVQPSGVTLGELVAAMKVDAVRGNLLAPLVAALEPLVQPDAYSRFFDDAAPAA